MHTRLISFTGATDFDGGVAYLRDEVLGILKSQKGYRGVSASAARDVGILSVLTLWDTEADRSASDSALGKARDEATKIVGGTMSVENFEQVAAAVKKVPVAGCRLIATRYSQASGLVEGNITFFTDELLPQIAAQPGFCAVRNMLDRATGSGVVGTIFENDDAMEAGKAGMQERRPIVETRGIRFDEITYREILLSEVV
jgi:hypothetical protein